jgi:hypothetical protein
VRAQAPAAPADRPEATRTEEGAGPPQPAQPAQRQSPRLHKTSTTPALEFEAEPPHISCFKFSDADVKRLTHAFWHKDLCTMADVILQAQPRFIREVKYSEQPTVRVWREGKWVDGGQKELKDLCHFLAKTMRSFMFLYRLNRQADVHEQVVEEVKDWLSSVQYDSGDRIQQKAAMQLALHMSGHNW